MSETLHRTLGYGPVSGVTSMLRVIGHTTSREEAIVAEELPVAMVFNGRSHVVIMATPADLEDLAIGFSLSEEIVTSRAEIETVDVVRFSQGIELQLSVSDAAAERIAARSRHLAARTGCGLCGVEAIADAVRRVGRVESPAQIRASSLWRAGSALEDRQPINADTHAVHAAAWASEDGDLRIVREDVGRHNAMDKVIGAMVRAHVDPRSGFMLVTSRASYELVQKCAAVGVPVLAAVSRPTGLAVRMANEAGMSLVALLRGESANVYAGQHRILAD